MKLTELSKQCIWISPPAFIKGEKWEKLYEGWKQIIKYLRTDEYPPQSEIHRLEIVTCEKDYENRDKVMFKVKPRTGTLPEWTSAGERMAAPSIVSDITYWLNQEQADSLVACPDGSLQ